MQEVSDPVLVEVLRGDTVESLHRGAVVVVDADGKTVLALGEIDRPVFPRSAVKTIQALPFVESGAADACGFGDRELALACSSHSGEAAHVTLAEAMLAKAGLAERALECGAHWPSSQDAMVELARAGKVPTQLHNNCSGKHSAFLCTCRHCGIDHAGYVEAGHPFQDMVRVTMEEVTGAVHGPQNRGIDGCSIPTYAVPLRSLALGFARMATGNGLGRERAVAAKRLMSACMAEPFYVAGTNRACTRLMEAAPGRIFVKTGAEGVFCGALEELGLGIAIKCDDGASRAAEVVVSQVLASLLHKDGDVSTRLAGLARPELRNWRGTHVGRLRPASVLATPIAA
ncbi:asparaginase [Mesorhizobium sp. L-8-3]|nr:asparaginase [Mesorhizobium sp. L-8-3]